MASTGQKNDAVDVTGSESGFASRRNAPEKSPLIGRSDELNILNDALKRVVAGSGQVIAISGEPGIGKTFLLNHLQQEARKRKIRVVSATCTSLPGAPPLWPWREIFSQLESTESAVESTDQLLADISDAYGAENHDSRRFKLFSGVVRELRRAAADTPLLICIDDMHWADSTSRDLFAFVAAQLSRNAVLMTTCLRSAETEERSESRAMLSSLGRLGNFTRVTPKLLDDDEVRELVERLVGHTVSLAAIGLIAGRSRGVPFFVRELSHQVDARGQSLRGELPEGIIGLIGSRIDGLSAETLEALQAAAIIGHSFTLDGVINVLNRTERVDSVSTSPSSILPLIDEAAVAGIVRAATETSGSFEFTHPLYSEVIRDRLPSGTRAGMHAAAADWLEYKYAAGASRHAGELAWHFKSASPILGVEKMVHYSLIAGQSALRSFAWTEALELFENVRSAVESDPECIELAQAWLGIARARMTYESWWGSSLRSDDIEAGLAVAFEIFVERGEIDLAIETASQGVVGQLGWIPSTSLAERALDFADDDSIATARLLTRYADVLWTDKSRQGESGSVIERAFEMARRHGELNLQLRILRIWAQFKMWEKEYSTVIDLRDQAVMFWKPGVESMNMALLNINAATAEGSLGDMASAERSLETGKAMCDELGIESIAYNLTRAQFALAQARFDEAVEQAREIERLENIAPATRLFEFIRETHTGDFHRALETGREILRGIPTTPAMHTYRAIYGLLILRIGEELGNHSVVDETRLIVSSIENLSPVDPLSQGILRRVKIKLTIVSGDADQAKRDYESLLSENDTYNMLAGGPANGLLLAQLALVFGDRSTAIDHFKGTLAFTKSSGFVVSECDTAKAYAKALIDSAGRVNIAQAVEVLKDAIKVAKRHNLKYMGESMEQLLSKATRGRVVFPAGLTPREVEVLRLIAEGKSNSEIGACLFISLNTVLRHVSNTFGKLVVSSRTEAAVKAVDLGLVNRS